MSNLKVNTINDASGGSAAVLYGVASPPNSMGFRNRIINGEMRIDQRNAGASGTASAYTVDRWYYYGSQASKATWQQNAGAVTPPTGFTNYLGATSSSAYSITSTDQFLLTQKIEGLNFSDLAWGTASAQAATLSFWVRSSLTGTFGGSIQNSAANRNYPFSFTISAANTWELETITIPGDTTGTWLATNGVGAIVNFSLGTGATYSATAGAWTGSSFISSATGATSVVGTNNATFYITGVQLEAGTVASPFERRDYGRELMMCYRYYALLGTLAGGYVITIGRGMSNGGNSGWRTMIQIPAPMRATPTLTATNLLGWNVTNSSVGLSGFGTVYLINGLCLEVDINYVAAVGASNSQVYFQTNSSGGASYLAVSSEL